VTDSGQFANSCTFGTLPFTYIGETFGFDTPPTFTVTAWNDAPTAAITTNYRGLYRKLDSSSITIADVTEDVTQTGTDGLLLNVEFIADNTILISPSTSDPDTLDYTFGNDQFRYGPEDPNDADFGKMSNSEVRPFDADIDLVLTQVVDLDGVETSFSPGIIFDVTGNQMRFGRLQMENVSGPETNDLQMPMVVEYLNGNGFYEINGDDNCTQIDTGDLDITLNPSTSTAEASITNSEAVNGSHGVTITAPGAGNNDVVEVSPNLNSSGDKWLRHDWNNDGNFDDEPSAIATFGIYTGSSVQIYIQ
jgi:MSHA biogenesis protein MshQ